MYQNQSLFTEVIRDWVVLGILLWAGSFVGICNTAVRRKGRLVLLGSDWRFACSCPTSLVSVHQVCGRSSLVSASIQLHLGGRSSMHSRRPGEGDENRRGGQELAGPSHPMAPSRFNSLASLQGVVLCE